MGRKEVRLKGSKGREEGEQHPCLPLPSPSQALKEAGLPETKTSATRSWVIIDVFVGQKGKEGLKMKEVRRQAGKFSGSQDTFIRSF